MLGLDGEDLAHGEPGSKESQLPVEVRWDKVLESDMLSIMIESNNEAETLGSPQLTHSQGMSERAMPESTFSDMFAQST